jgi:hypothetical protein
MLDDYESSEGEAGGVSHSEEAGTWAAGDDGGWCVEMGWGVVRSTNILQASTAATAATQLQQPRHATAAPELQQLQRRRPAVSLQAEVKYEDKLKGGGGGLTYQEKLNGWGECLMSEDMLKGGGECLMKGLAGEALLDFSCCDYQDRKQVIRYFDTSSYIFEFHFQQAISNKPYRCKQGVYRKK